MSIIRSDEELCNYSKHLTYEVNMMRECLLLLEERDQDKTVRQFAVLESFLIHVRVIWDFVHKSRNSNPSRPHKDDIIAEDYFEKPEQWQPGDNSFLNETCGNINKVLAHLTEERLTEKQWDCNRIYDALVPYLRRFRSDVSVKRLDPGLLRANLASSFEHRLFTGGVVTTSPQITVSVLNVTKTKQ